MVRFQCWRNAIPQTNIPTLYSAVYSESSIVSPLYVRSDHMPTDRRAGPVSQLVKKSCHARRQRRQRSESTSTYHRWQDTLPKLLTQLQVHAIPRFTHALRDTLGGTLDGYRKERRCIVGAHEGHVV